MSILKTDEIIFESKNLYVPSLEEVKIVLQNALRSNFYEVKVEVVDCPNLKNEPYGLADSGLAGSPTLIEVGGPPYLLPLVDSTKIYNVVEVIQNAIKTSERDLFVLGAGAGPFMLHNQNCEGIYNLRIKASGEIQNQSYISRVVGADEACVLEKVPELENRIALLANLFACEGKTDKVLYVYCKKRIGEHNFITSLRLALKNFYKEKCVGLGGVFIFKNGLAHQHVMRSFSKKPIDTEKELNQWLKFYEMPAKLTAVGTLITNEIDLDLRLQHFHSFSESNWGGHYHCDITPEIAEYEGYFNIGEKVVRVDKPINTHQFGRD